MEKSKNDVMSNAGAHNFRGLNNQGKSEILPAKKSIEKVQKFDAKLGKIKNNKQQALEHINDRL